MKINILAAALFSICAINLNAQQADSTANRPGQVTFIYPLGTSGIESPQYSNNFSFNVLYGINGGLNGIEFSCLVNSNVGDVTGAQFAGIANVNTKKTNGVMTAGITNIVKDSSNALCFAGISNVMGKSAMGLHFAGIANTINGNFIGAQFAGISNLTNGSVIGAQLAGISNISNGDYIGFQAAGITNTVNGNFTGAQVAFVNTAKKIKGFQLGFINIAEEFEKGVPFGFLSFVKNGFHAIELSGGESIYGNATLKLGVDQLYNIFKFGYAANGSENYLTYGVGLGSMVSLTEKAKISFDISGNQIVQATYSPKLDILARGDAAFRYNFGDHIGIFAGPSFNVYMSEHNVDTEKSALAVPYTLYSQNWWNNEGSTSIWIGANAGLSIMF